MTKKWVVGLCSMSLALALGCGANAGNGGGGGGNIITAASKVVFGTMSRLTPDEIQILVEAVNQSNLSNVDVTIDDAQSEAAAQFLKANDVNTIQDIQNLVNEIENNPDAVVVPPAVVALIAAGDLPEVTGQ